MKKLLALLLAGLTLLALCACGSKTDAAAEEAAAPKEELVAASDTAPAAVVEEDSSTGKGAIEPTVEIPEAGALDSEQFELAKTYIGKSVDELIAAIGEPDSSEFSASCLADGAEDGVLYYGAYGFYVYALRETDGTETVQNIVAL